MSRVNEATKIEIAVTAKQHNDLSVKDLATLFEVSEYIVRSSREKFADEAEKKLEEIEEEKLSHYRGFHGRNGRMELIRQALKELGTNAKAGKVIDRVDQLSEQHGLKPIKRTAAYVLVGEQRKRMEQSANDRSHSHNVHEIRHNRKPNNNVSPNINMLL